MKRLITMMIVLVSILACRSADTGKDAMKNDLIGIWQDTDYVAAGWSNVFIFYPDGKFRFHTSQMACAERDRGYGGLWRLSGRNLVLTVNKQWKIAGGKVVDDEVCGEKIEGGREVERNVAAQEKVLPLSPLRFEKSSNRFGEQYERFTLSIDGEQYWKFDDDQEKYD